MAAPHRTPNITCGNGVSSRLTDGAALKTGRVDSEPNLLFELAIKTAILTCHAARENLLERGLKRASGAQV